MNEKQKKRRQASFARILRPYWGWILLLSVLTVILSLLQVALAMLSRFVIDAALNGKGDFAFWGALLVADMLALVCAHCLLIWFTGSTHDKVVVKLRKSILRTAVFVRDEQLQQQHSGTLLNRAMEDVHTICDGAANVLPSMVGQIARLVATFAAVAVLSPAVAAVLMAVALIIGVSTACLRPVMRTRQRAVRESEEVVMATMQEDLQQLELIQSLSAQHQVLSRLDRLMKRSLRQLRKRRVWLIGSNALLSAASQIGSGALLLWGAAQIATGAMSYGTLTAMLQLLALFRAPVVGLSGLWGRFATMDVAAERLEPLLQSAQEAQPVETADALCAIVFENVTFSYPGDDAPVLENFSFRFPIEGWTCLTGVSGRGKTTVFKLILGLYTPQTGRIYLQTERGEIPCTEATRHLFAYVPQDYALLSGTILENMQLVEPDVDMPRLREVLEIAQADFVWELTDREQTQVRENNAGLSKGQLQRLAIARAILMDRPVLLLDECTSALDAGTEAALLHKLHALDKRAILVTHRPEALQDLPGIDKISMEQ